MIVDLESDVYTPIAREVRTQFPGASVSGEYMATPPSWPHVSIIESDNYMSINRLDSGEAEKYSTVMYEVNVYSNKQSGKKAEARQIMGVIDHMLYARNFTRLSLTPVPNMEDAKIYRLTARYRAETDGISIYRI